MLTARRDEGREGVDDVDVCPEEMSRRVAGGGKFLWVEGGWAGGTGDEVAELAAIDSTSDPDRPGWWLLVVAGYLMVKLLSGSQSAGPHWPTQRGHRWPENSMTLDVFRAVARHRVFIILFGIFCLLIRYHRRVLPATGTPAGLLCNSGLRDCGMRAAVFSRGTASTCLAKRASRRAQERGPMSHGYYWFSWWLSSLGLIRGSFAPSLKASDSLPENATSQSLKSHRRVSRLPDDWIIRMTSSETHANTATSQSQPNAPNSAIVLIIAAASTLTSRLGFQEPQSCYYV